MHPFSQEVDMEYICIGKIVNTHGIRGELKISSYSDFDSVRYKKGNTVLIFHDGAYVPVKVVSFRTHKGFSLVAFEGLQDINLVEQYKNDEVFINEKDRQPLRNGEYYRSDLEGLQVIDEEDHPVGVCLQVEETNGAQNNLRIRKSDGSEVLIPYVKSFIREVSLEQRYIRIHVIEGLL